MNRTLIQSLCTFPGIRHHIQMCALRAWRINPRKCAGRKAFLLQFHFLGDFLTKKKREQELRSRPKKQKLQKCPASLYFLFLFFLFGALSLVLCICAPQQKERKENKGECGISQRLAISSLPHSLTQWGASKDTLIRVTCMLRPLCEHKFLQESETVR